MIRILALMDEVNVIFAHARGEGLGTRLYNYFTSRCGTALLDRRPESSGTTADD